MTMLNTLGLRQMQTTFWITNVNSLATVNYGGAMWLGDHRRRLHVANVPYLHKMLPVGSHNCFCAHLDT